MTQVEAVRKLWQRTVDKNKHYKPLMKVHLELVETLEAYAPPPLSSSSVPEDEMNEKLSQGVPFLNGWEDTIDSTSAQRLFTALCRWSGLGKAKNQFKRAAMHLTGQDIENLLCAFLEGNEEEVARFAAAYQLPLDVLIIVLRYSLLPTLNRYSEHILNSGLFDDEKWMRPYCPVCGDRHGLAEFRGDERIRHFRCLSCAADWKYWRIGCPYCENRDHEQLHSWFFQEETGHYQLDVCERCHGYVKGVNKIERSSIPVLLFDDFLTTSLDYLAQEKGFHLGAGDKLLVH
ncbi:FdhE protein [Caldalkalibacillus uzonensis]|uniref:FdhE protein n=1 Tax=Caldalkalibacillus uzonensis TaxID=353224 RepID=A0ABU0CT80_9BACI|nr:formate dehydrogenase accessory protein FdhE [Caldalkalibacillus uzonensis]MDQ0339623.1 FdhE protein [Caldalkalibacillus uzonensis]